MQSHLSIGLWFALAVVVIAGLSIGSVLAHEGRPVGDYRFVVGWLEEPAYEGARNAVSVTITKAVETEDSTGEGAGHPDKEESAEGHNRSDTDSAATSGAMQGMAGMSGQHHEQTAPVEGLEGSIQVEVTHVATGVSATWDLLAVFGEPGHYVAHVIPTATGVYEFRVFGTVEGIALDETFVSRGGGGGFDDIRDSTGLHFPEDVPELREVESGVRGALQTAQQAQDAALAAQEQGGVGALTIVALIVGIVGVVFGIAGIFFGLRARQS